MIIALDARPLYTAQIGGAEQHARNVVRQWAQLRVPHKFVLLLEQALENSEDFDESFVGELPPNQFTTVSVPRLRYLSRWWLASRYWLPLNRLMYQRKVEVYHSFTALVPRTNACPIVQTIHDLAVELDPDMRRQRRSGALRRVIHLGANEATRIVTVSQQTKNDIMGLYNVAPERIRVVYNGINPIFQPSPATDTQSILQKRWNFRGPYVLAVGSDTPRRNYARLLEAMQQVWQRLPRVRLMLAGRNDWYTTPIYALAKKLNVEQQLICVQSPSDAELAQLYRDAVLTCCASSFEGFGLSVLEAMACGSPVVCSDLSSLREVAREAAVYFIHDDTDTLTQALLGVAEDGEYQRRLRAHGLQRAQNFTWTTAALAILEVIEEAAHQRRAPVPADLIS
jgi:glycosyltransferase involved in cell wall biosynthesis